MKTLIAFALMLFVALPASALARGDVHVRGYYRHNGAYVQPYYRSVPDRSYSNNWSTNPNINPYTGREGTRQSTWNDPPPQQGNSYRHPVYGNPYGSSRKRSSDLNHLQY